MPPKTTNEKGEPRRVGVEIEFGGLDVDRSAELVRDVFGGEIEKRTAHRSKVTGTRIGDFEIELDSHMVHPDDKAGDVERSALRLVGDVSRMVVPTEIVGPPAEITHISDFDALIDALRRAGTEGTRDHLAYGFGVHLNPEAPSHAAADIRDMLRAYVLLSPLLRRRIAVDPMRRLLPYIDPFPADYLRRILGPDYAPDLDTLIDDYLLHNPTRNRELDMLPLFAFLDEERVRKFVDDPRIKGRPTYHYRLPDTNLSDPAWGISVEWNRWVMVERVAADRARLSALSGEYLRRNPDDFLERITVQVRDWFEDFSR